MKKLDALFIHPNASEEIYQDLSRDFSAIEQPIWAGMLANHCRIKGFNVELMDCEALGMGDEVAIHHIKHMNPRLIIFVVYGQQPSASSQNMEGAIRLAEKIKMENYFKKILFVGGHVSALSKEVLKKHECVDFVCQNEGVYTISELLKVTDFDDPNEISKIPGLGFSLPGEPFSYSVFLNGPSLIVPKDKLSQDLPGVAWDILPMSYYRTSLWHALPNNAERQPFASLYTSLGCPFRCSFCLDEDTKITILNGHNKKIKDVNINDTLISYNIKNKELEETKIKKISRRIVNEIYYIELENGKSLKCTGEHPIFMDGKWIKAEKIKIGDKVLVINNKDKMKLKMKLYNPNIKVKTIKKIKEKHTVYNFECYPHNNFFAENILTHNCMINIINRQENEYSDGSNIFRFWDPNHIIKDFEYFAKEGITNIKIADEMFVLNPNHFLKLCDLIIQRQYKFNIWAYARIDTVKDKYLETLKKAGVNWLALGIESGNKKVRSDVIKGKFQEVDIRDIVKKIRDHGINVIANYIFGLPEDTKESMAETLDLALEMNTEEANFYSAMAYPGSPLYGIAKKNEWKLPETYAGYSQHSYYTQPIPSKYLSPEEILKFRDEAWMKYHTNPDYLSLIKDKFGDKALDQTIKSTKIKLKRKLLGD